jgi:hypothetical protein
MMMADKPPSKKIKTARPGLVPGMQESSERPKEAKIYEK